MQWFVRVSECSGLFESARDTNIVLSVLWSPLQRAQGTCVANTKPQNPGLKLNNFVCHLFPTS